MRIAIVGSHGTGKTSLLNKLSEKIDFAGYDFYQEAIRDAARIGFSCNEDADDSTQLSVCAIQLLHLKSTKMVTDRCLLDNYVYAYMLRNRGSNISDYCVDIIKTYFINNLDKYNFYAFCPNQFELKDDGFRMLDRDFQQEISGAILSTLIKYVPRHKYILLNGNTNERVKQVVEFKREKEKRDD